MNTWEIDNEINYWKSWFSGPILGYTRAKNVISNLKRLYELRDDETENWN